MRYFEQFTCVAALCGVLGMLPPSASAAEVIATVSSSTGASYIEGPDGRRPIECGSPIHDGERIVTESGASVGLVVDDVYLQIGDGADVVVRQSEIGGPSFAVNSGRVRILDDRDSGSSAIQILTPHASAEGVGTDTEVTVSAERSLLCEVGRNLPVAGNQGGRAMVPPGQCLTVQGGVLASATSDEEELTLAPAAGCFDVALAGHFTPETAAAPAGIRLAPLDPNRRLFLGCEGLGQGCGELPTDNFEIFEPEAPACPSFQPNC